MLQELISAFNAEKGAKFVAFTYTNKFGEVAKRVIQINTIYENALRKDLDIIPNVEYVENDKYDENLILSAIKGCCATVNIVKNNESFLECVRERTKQIYLANYKSK